MSFLLLLLPSMHVATLEIRFSLNKKFHPELFKAHMYVRSVISQDFSWFQDLYKSPFVSKCSWKKRSSHQGKKEVACIVSSPLVSYLWGCGESVNPPELKIQDVQGALSSWPKACYFSGLLTSVKSHPWSAPCSWCRRYCYEVWMHICIYLYIFYHTVSFTILYM